MTGRDTAMFQKGYQAALIDLQRALDQGGEEAAQVWIDTNKHEQ